ncbi:hypothetical protein NDU88_002956 [Pleurodeles waltl]|uniref:Uncharacterized protein n=1 Tax=Pleurodeles waltl TaxID=8319 RepID=A0AAV7MQ98_PLEWA|nr:hypothetical protein NDU88_002956 [Pleurodeles waltl]
MRRYNPHEDSGGAEGSNALGEAAKKGEGGQSSPLESHRAPSAGSKILLVACVIRCFEGPSAQVGGGGEVPAVSRLPQLRAPACGRSLTVLQCPVAGAAECALCRPKQEAAILAPKCQRYARVINLRGSAANRRPRPGQAEFLLPALNGRPPPPMWCMAPSTPLGGRHWSSAKMTHPSVGVPGSPPAPPRGAGTSAQVGGGGEEVPAVYHLPQLRAPPCGRSLTVPQCPVAGATERALHRPKQEAVIPAPKCQRCTRVINPRGSVANRRPRPGHVEFLLPVLNGRPPPPMWRTAPSTPLGGRRWSSTKMTRPILGSAGIPAGSSTRCRHTLSAPQRPAVGDTECALCRPRCRGPPPSSAHHTVVARTPQQRLQSRRRSGSTLQDVSGEPESELTD